MQAYSLAGAKRIYLATRRSLRKGDQFSIKPRGSGEWNHYKVL